jgi:hypothetical protein
MLLRGVAVADDRLQAAAIDGAEGDGDTRAHPPDSHAPIGNPDSDSPSPWVRCSSSLQESQRALTRRMLLLQHSPRTRTFFDALFPN